MLINSKIAEAVRACLLPVILISAAWIFHSQPSRAQEPESSEPVTERTRKAEPDGTYPDVTAFTDSDAEQGRINLNTFCSRCHGRDGRGAKGPDLTDRIFRHAKTDKEIIDTISNGISGTGMPGFSATYEDYYKPILAYIRIQSARAHEQGDVPMGNVERGRELFVKNQCASCHWTGKEGGRRGTNLAKLTATPSYVRESMRYPNSQIDPDYQQVSILDDTGRIIKGQRLRENTADILVMDDQEQLHSISKREVEVKYVHESLMPSFREALSETDIEDITTYIFTLQKKVSEP